MTYDIRITSADAFEAMARHYEALGYKFETVCLPCGDLILKVYEAPKSLPTISDDLIFEIV